MSLVLWSGGCDSTLILDRLLVNSSESWPVRALTILHEQVTPTKQPAAARKRAKSYWKKKGYHLVHTEVTVSNDGDFEATNCGGGLIQPAFWISVAIPYLDEREDLYVGYIKDDCIWHYKNNLQAVFDQWQYVTGRSGKLRAPFEWAHKRVIINALKKTGDLYKRTWWCERDDHLNKVCGKCDPCKLHRTAEWQIKQGMDMDGKLPSVFYS